MENKKWMMKFRRENIFSKAIGRYVVEADDQRGEVIGFKEIKEQT